ncbi:hypothetical protein RI367_005049 [Sorochytrium milnesiophthora]
MNNTTDGLTDDQQQRLQAAQAYAAEVTRQYAERTAQADGKPVPLMTPFVHRTINRVYVGGVAYSAPDTAIKELFSRFGYVRDVSMTLDADRTSHRGYGFIEFDVAESADLAMQHLNGVEFMGKILKVNRTNSYNPDVFRHLPPRLPERIFFSNIHEQITEDSLRTVFAPFGELKNFALCPDIVARKHKTYGYAEYTTADAASAAVSVLNNFKLGGDGILVCHSVVGGPFPEGMSALARFAGSNGTQHNGSSTPSSAAAAAGAAAAQQPPSSAVLLLKNMVTPDDVDELLRQDVAEECSKFGKVQNVAVHVNRQTGPGESGVRLFVLFASSEECETARKGLNGRFFGGRQLLAVPYPMRDFAQGQYDK